MIKGLFRRKKKAKEDIFKQGEFNMSNIELFENRQFLVYLAYASPMVETIYPACAACYGISEDKNQTYEEKVEYIGRRVKSHHTSILEHSNIVVQAYIPLKDNVLAIDVENINMELTDITDTDQDIITLISEVRDQCRYLSVESHIESDLNGDPVLKMTFGGSLRGYRYIFENIENRKNKLFISIFEVLKFVVPAPLFIDFILDDVMTSYIPLEITKELAENIAHPTVTIKTEDNVDIISMDDLQHISKLTGLDMDKCLDFVSITVNFKNMSRIITQQVTRHRNGITQESQRYVNYSEAVFNSPSKFKDKYDEEKLYDTPIGPYTLNDLGNLITSLYRYLVDQGLEKEDARGFLPLNVQCGKLFMTFTLRTLFNFLDLRLDPHAQAEVREYAELLANLTENYARQLDIGDMASTAGYFSMPKYKRIEEQDFYNGIDEEV